MNKYTAKFRFMCRLSPYRAHTDKASEGDGPVYSVVIHAEIWVDSDTRIHVEFQGKFLYRG